MKEREKEEAENTRSSGVGGNSLGLRDSKLFMYEMTTIFRWVWRVKKDIKRGLRFPLRFGLGLFFYLGFFKF